MKQNYGINVRDKIGKRIKNEEVSYKKYSMSIDVTVLPGQSKKITEWSMTSL